MARKRDAWKDVDWVLLGSLGWDIDSTGAGYYGLKAGALPDGGSVGNPGCDPWCALHLDSTTLDIIMHGGDIDWLDARLRELRMAGVARQLTLVPRETATAGSGSYVEVRFGPPTSRHS